MLSNKEIYNNAYKKFTPDYVQSENISEINRFLTENRESLVDFIEKYAAQFDLEHRFNQMSCLELGCGVGSLSFYLSDRFNEFSAIDYSELAIVNAKAIAKLKNTYVDFQVVDVCSKTDLSKKYDVIIDSHLFHCLTTTAERSNYLSFVKRHLAEGGVFLLETMVFQKSMQFPVGYAFDQDYVLYKELEDNPIPVRSIKKSMDIEGEFKNAGLNINYLYYHNELSFNVFEDYPNHPVDYLPKTLRLSAKLG